MDTRKLAAFVDLAKTLNYTTTAAHLFTTQATVSKQIISLEKELDVQLFDRGHRQVRLTAMGTALLPAATAVVTAVNQLQKRLGQEQAAAGQRLTIRAIPSIAQYRAFNLITGFAKQHPEITLDFAEAETATLFPALDHGQADVIFTRLFTVEPSPYDVLIGDTDEFVVVLPKTDPLAQHAGLTAADVSDRPLLLLDESTQLYQPVIAVFAAQGLTPKVSYRGKRIDLILGMINRGMGLSIMMGKSFDLTDYPGLTIVPIAPPQTSQLAFLRRHGHQTPATTAFWAFLHAHHD